MSAETMPETANPRTCPSCGATVLNDVPWCLQCYADLRPAPSPPARPRPQEPSLAADAHAGDEPADAPDSAGAPDAVGAPGAPLRREDAERLADELVAQLARQDGRTPDWQSRLPSTSTGKALAVLGLAVGAGLLVLLGLTLLGLLA
jgi:hypothetical protein